MQEIDPLDRAARLTEETLDRAIAETRAKAQHRELRPTGRCHWCEERVGRGLIFCEPDPGEPAHCAEDWRRAQDARRRNAGPAI